VCRDDAWPADAAVCLATLDPATDAETCKGLLRDEHKAKLRQAMDELRPDVERMSKK
jgi:hypothetical protein